MTFQTRHLIAAVVLHGALFTLLAGGMQCSRKVTPPVVMQAVLLDPNRQDLNERKRQDDQRRKRAEEEKRRRQAEEEQKKKLAEQKRVEDEKKKAEFALKQKQAEEKKQKEAEAQRQKQELERKKKAEEEARRRKEEDETEFRQRLAEEERQREQAELQRQVEAEQRARTSKQRDQQLALWVTQIEDKVRRNWMRPLAAPEEFTCKVRVEQLPGGQVVNARIVTSCGSPALDESVVRAVMRSDPLPVAPDPAIFTRDLVINFVP